MSFVKKTWEDRISEYPTRRKIIDVDSGDERIVDVERAEGEVVNAGTALSADNFNDLEERIFTTFNEVGEEIEEVNSTFNAESYDLSLYGVSYGQAVKIGNMVTINGYQEASIESKGNINTTALPENIRPSVTKHGFQFYTNDVNVLTQNQGQINTDGFIINTSGKAAKYIVFSFCYTI